MKITMALAMALTAGLGLTACGGSKKKSGDAAASYAITGTLALSLTAANHSGINTMAAKTVTHVMAINPESANPSRYITAIGSDGTFSLKVVPNRPYVMVFVDNTKVGKDMIVGIFKANTLDSVAPIGTDGTTDLGALSIDASTEVATSAVSYDDLLTRMGLSAADALTLGAVDDLSLRYANPDIDGNGTIDSLENKTFGLDFHLRADMKKGDASDFTVDDVLNKFGDVSGATVELATFGGSSIYALYPSTFDSTACVNTNTQALQNSCTFTSSDGLTAQTYSSLGFGDVNGYGGDFSLPTHELAGSTGTPTDITYTFNGHTLTYSNVVTRTAAQLGAAGTIIPFVKLVTAGASTTGVITEIDYKWMKKVSATEWTQATDDEVKLIINDDGGKYGLYINTDHAGTARAHAIGFNIPRTATGTIPFTLAASDGGGDLTAAQVAAIVPLDICNGAFSYDDKLGLRIFAGAPKASPGRTLCP